MESFVLGSKDTADKGAAHRNINNERNQWDPELKDTHFLLPDGSVVKNSPANAGHAGSIGKTPWSRKWQPTPVFLPRKSHGQRSLAGYSPCDCKESDMTEQLSMSSSTWSTQHMNETHTHTQTGKCNITFQYGRDHDKIFQSKHRNRSYIKKLNQNINSLLTSNTNATPSYSHLPFPKFTFWKEVAMHSTRLKGREFCVPSLKAM